MQASVVLGDLKNPADVKKLQQILEELYDLFDLLYETTTPNGNIEAHRGKLCIFKNGTVYETWQNVDGDKTWERIDNTKDFVTGDWIISSVTTARAGWTNKSATYADKFMRVNATPLTTGGADTHTHTIPAHDHGAVTGSHILTESEIPAHTHDTTLYSGDSGANSWSANGVAGISLVTSGSTGGGGGHTHTVTEQAQATSGSGDNVPAYVQVVIFQKD